jgi:polygalacturonase
MQYKHPSFTKWVVLGLFVLLFLNGGANLAYSDSSYNIVDFGAVPDGETLNTKFIQGAIDVCFKKGGGTVYIPSGSFLTGPIELKTNIRLYIESGAVLLFSDDPQHYPPVRTRWAGTMCYAHHPLIFAREAKNVTICGAGIVDGQGGAWWQNFAEARNQTNYEPQTKIEKEFARLNRGISGGYMEWAHYHFRPPLVQLYSCENVMIRDVTLQNSPFWTVHPLFSKNINIENVTIKGPHDSPNTDGIDIDSSSQIRIQGCHISVGDDCIVLKSGLDQDGRDIGIPTEDVTIMNCTMYAGHGGVVIGSDMSADVRNVVISNCVFNGTDRGIRLKSRRGRGGIVENVRVSNIVMQEVEEAIVLNMFYESGPPHPSVADAIPIFRNIQMSQIQISNSVKFGYLRGLQDMPLQNIRLSDITCNIQTGLECQDVKGLDLYDIKVKVEKGPALKCINVSDLNIHGFDPGPYTKQLDSFINLESSHSVCIDQCNIPSAMTHFVELSGPSTRDIRIVENMRPYLFLNDSVSTSEIRSF